MYTIRKAAEDVARHVEEAKEKVNTEVVIENEKLATASFWIGVISAVSIILYTVFHCRGIAKTNITVYENGIIGTGCGKYFDVNFDLHDFQLAFDKITSVDKHSTAIIIHAGERYKCYVANPVEIQTLIVKHQQNMKSIL